MRFLSNEVQQAFQVFQSTSFCESRRQILDFLCQSHGPLERVEGLSLLLRINTERDDGKELEEIRLQALELVATLGTFRTPAAPYLLGIVFIQFEEIDWAEKCFQSCFELAEQQEDRLYARYGLAAVEYNRKDSARALKVLGEIQGQSSGDLLCLVQLLKGNCMRMREQYEEALEAFRSAQAVLNQVRGFYLKNWVFFGLGSIYSRKALGDKARAYLEIVLSITDPIDFRRLHKLASDELARLDMRVELLLDPITGDMVSNVGYLSLRRKPTLIAILSSLLEVSPQLLSKEALYRKVWGGEYHPLRHDGLIYSHIQRLRSALVTDMKLKDLILTGQDGYQLNPHISVKFRRPTLPSYQESVYELR